MENTEQKKRRGNPNWGKGRSANPNGRPKQTPDELNLIAACRQKTPAALDVIEHIMINGEQERNRLTAAMAIIERAYGKPAQEIKQDVNVEHSGTIEHLSISKINDRIAELLTSREPLDNPSSLPH